MPPTRLYLGLFFGVFAALFLLLAFRPSRSNPGNTQPVKAFARIGFIFAAVSLSLLLSSWFLQ
jgi:hypothetical protein